MPCGFAAGSEEGGRQGKREGGGGIKELGGRGDEKGKQKLSFGYK